MKKTMTPLLACAVLAACAGSPEPVSGVSLPATIAPASMPAPAVDTFEETLKKELEKFTPAPTRGDTGESDAVDQLRRATKRERELLGELRRNHAAGRALPLAMVGELRQVRDDLYEARWRILVESTASPLPPEMLELVGGAS